MFHRQAEARIATQEKTIHDLEMHCSSLERTLTSTIEEWEEKGVSWNQKEVAYQVSSHNPRVHMLQDSQLHSILFLAQYYFSTLQ